jgi:hypothetical protein
VCAVLCAVACGSFACICVVSSSAASVVMEYPIFFIGISFIALVYRVSHCKECFLNTELKKNKISFFSPSISKSKKLMIYHQKYHFN